MMSETTQDFPAKDYIQSLYECLHNDTEVKLRVFEALYSLFLTADNPANIADTIVNYLDESGDFTSQEEDIVRQLSVNISNGTKKFDIKTVNLCQNKIPYDLISRIMFENMLVIDKLDLTNAKLQGIFDEYKKKDKVVTGSLLVGGSSELVSDDHIHEVNVKVTPYLFWPSEVLRFFFTKAVSVKKTKCAA